MNGLITDLISILYLIIRKSLLQAEYFFRFEQFWLKLQPKLGPQNQKSWLRPCIKQMC